MAFSDELFFAPASQLLKMLRERQVSSAEMVSAFIERIESLNHHINAVVALVEERAAVESDAADRGSPVERRFVRLRFADHHQGLESRPEGIRSTDGMKILEHYVPPEDAPTVARLRAAARS